MSLSKVVQDYALELSKIFHAIDRKEKLCLILFLLEYHGDKNFSISNIESNLKLFYTNDIIKHFQSNYIRSLTSEQTLNIKINKITEDEKLWYKHQDIPFWQNTPKGNQLAIKILADNGIDL